jgi:cysteine-rich repeat protein
MRKVFKIKILLISFLLLSIPLASLRASVASDMEVLLFIGNYCGDGAVQSGEECDDGNRNDGDGCSAVCVLEVAEPPIEGGSNGVAPKIFNVEKQILGNDVLISWETNRLVLSELWWGETQEVSDQKIFETVRKINHQTTLKNLETGKEYFFKIVVNDFLRGRAETQVFSVIIFPEDDSEAPKNVSNLKAVYKNGKVHLTWENPIDSDLQAVKVLRKDDIFSNYINDGLVIFNSKGEEAIDPNVEFDELYFYTVYTYDNDFNFSSGVGVAVKIPEKKQPLGQEDVEQDLDDILDDKDEYIQDDQTISQNEFSFKDIVFKIAKKTIIKENDKQGDLDFLPGTIVDIEIDKNNLPRGLKTIIFSIENTENEEKNIYLAKIDKENNFYRTQMAVPQKKGHYDLNIVVLNYKNGQYLKIKQTIKVEDFGKISLEEIKSLWMSFLETVFPKDLNQSKLTLFVKKDGTFKKWQARKFYQFNPLFVDYKNEFGFLVENGDYLLRIEQPGFWKRTYFLRVENNLINSDHKMIAVPYLDKKFILILIFVVSFTVITIKRLIKKIIKNKKNKK